MDKIVEYLKQLELSDIEAKLYLTLLKTGPLSVRDLAESSGMKRTTAYLYIDQLIEKGLIMKIVKGAEKLIAANDPDDSLEHLVKKKLEEAKRVKEKFPTMINTITSLPQIKDIGDAEIKYYKGISSIKKIYDAALSSNEFRLYVNLSQLESLLMPNDVGIDYDMFERGLIKNPQLKIKEILADEPEIIKQFNLTDTAQNPRYLYKFMPPQVGLTAPGILLYDNKVAIINGKPDKPVCVVLYNSDYYTNSKKLFDYIWGTLPDIQS